VLSLPAIAVADESYSYSTPFGRCIYSRKEGEALHPERDSADTYKKIRANVGSYIFQSQYQQNPASLEGGLIKKEWLRYYEHSVFPNDFTWILQSWDTAWKIGEANDYSVCTTWRLVGANFYLIDVFRARLSYPDLKRAVVDLYNKYQPCEILIENQSSGIALIEELKREFIYTVTAWKPEGGEDKYQRLAAESIKFEEGRILLPKQAEWVDEYIRELTAFPGAKHDDQVDSTTQALAYLTSKANAFAPFRETDARTIYPMHYPYEYS